MFVYVYVTVIGLISGSFINAWVWRLSKQLDSEGNKKNLPKFDKKKYSLLYSRSMCPNCHHKLGFLDLIPIISWIFLRGKCRYCKKPISLQYPLVELLTALLFFISAYFWDYSTPWSVAALITWLALLVGLIALALYDFKYMILPTQIIYKLYIVLFIGLGIQFILGRPIEQLLSMLISALLLGGLFWLLYQISKGSWIGGGDVRLGYLLGFILFTTISTFLMLFIASILALLIGTIMAKINNKKIKSLKLPFGPFLISATYISVIFGQEIINLYLSLI